MPIRVQFEQELNKIKNHINEMSLEVKEALHRSIFILYNGDIEQAKQLIEDDKAIDKKEIEINEEAILMIAKQQPVATDLRRLIAAIKISSDLERMADHTKNIVKAAIHLGEDHDINIHPQLREMAVLAMDMVDLAVKAFEYEDISLARKLATLDDEIDEMYGGVVKQLLESTAINPEQIQHIMQMAYTARYIERFADHITNIGEHVLYLVKGKNVDLNN
ncbi:phosphate signaling complex protein PhoU [Halobacillus campisalis]|uniref:Phosphate-specific transport system accessory protein PhoU n=1 Tax=Halobacillus campisalis TaxID=435909 RepID=A0ABW2K407_9BACI|nr:phosphate signaling complex protein PhoU [Halobacillus campisalis]